MQEVKDLLHSEIAFHAKSYIDALQNAQSIEHVQKVPLPDPGDENFVFLSYSHKDYQKVLSQ